jgi:hypothetical protein
MTVGLCETGSEPLSSIKVENYLNNYQLSKKDPAPWSERFIVIWGEDSVWLETELLLIQYRSPSEANSHSGSQ